MGSLESLNNDQILKLMKMIITIYYYQHQLLLFLLIERFCRKHCQRHSWFLNVLKHLQKNETYKCESNVILVSPKTKPLPTLNTILQILSEKYCTFHSQRGPLCDYQLLCSSWTGQTRVSSAYTKRIWHQNSHRTKLTVRLVTIQDVKRENDCLIFKIRESKPALVAYKQNNKHTSEFC